MAEYTDSMTSSQLLMLLDASIEIDENLDFFWGSPEDAVCLRDVQAYETMEDEMLTGIYFNFDIFQQIVTCEIL